MCEHHHSPSLRHGSALEHGHAHTEDHARWSRRAFLTSLSAAAGSMVLLGRTPVTAYGQTPLLAHLRNLQTDRVLVLVQLGGGNDGLNTIVPYQNDVYYNARPGLAISANEVIPISTDLGMHPSFANLESFYGDGHMAIVQNVGYPTPDLSHFRSTDIWASASDSDVVDNTGWVGRYLDTSFPDFETDPPDYPLAVKIGGGSPMLFQGSAANMGMSLTSVELLERIAESGLLYNADHVPATTFGNEMAFVRNVANDSFRYAGNIQVASATGVNRVEYPDNNPLSNNLAILARLIKGNLGARVYQVSLSGFDTHANQAFTHATLLRYIAEAVSAFYADLTADGMDDRVMTMTFSEFGRRVQQNGSNGTDHGTAAPLFVFGSGVNGGLYGNAPDLVNLDNGNIRFEHDFRSVYATALQDWFGLSAADVDGVLGRTFPTLGFVSDPTSTQVEPEEVPASFILEQNYPNPFNPTTTISYTLRTSSRVTLRVYDVQGRVVSTLVDQVQAAGTYIRPFNAETLPSGAYFYRLTTPASEQTRQMVLLR